MISQFFKFIIGLIVISSVIYAQQKELSIKPTESQGDTQILGNYPDRAGIVFYSQFDNLSFTSTENIVKVLGNPGTGKYILILNPEPQTIKINAPGYNSGVLTIESLSVGKVLFYELKTKVEGEDDENVIVAENNQQLSPNEPVQEEGSKNIPEKSQISPLTVKTIPQNATVFLNGENKGSTDLGLYTLSGVYDLRIELKDYLPIQEKIVVTPTNDKTKNIFSYNLIRNKGNLVITTVPSEAVITIDGEIGNVGKNELDPGKHQLEVKSPLYIPYSEEIEVKIGDTLQRHVVLNKNAGILELTVKPDNALIKINKEIKAGKKFQLNPGLYEVEISADNCFSEVFTVQIENGITVNRKVELKQRTGTLQFTIKPITAIVTLSQNGEEKYKWEGMNFIENIQTGRYDLLAVSPEYADYRIILIIEEGKTLIKNIDMVKWRYGGNAVFVEGGTFTMGCTSEQGNDCEDDEKPSHQVTLSDFYIGKYEVTQELWMSVMGSNPSWYKGSKLPVEKVSWYEAVEFCNRLSDREGLQRAYSGSGDNITCDFSSNGYRLPTEAEWEYAARGGKQTKNYKYSGSDNTGAVAWYDGNSGDKTHAVGLKQPNEIGIYDMSGNVWEWCWDWYGDYTSPSQTNPKGPSSGTWRVLRGGSWDDHARYCRVANRAYDMPDGRSSRNGFRLARTR
ncbi:MAG: SUMF1/EgtB/PvdO family nonheme iron enzyme [Ignavibacteriales bacterium]|nr:SUMF1/EgtB/PvdO family nonheme iron enzyme [Ignavibacteriales bacterium]